MPSSLQSSRLARYSIAATAAAAGSGAAAVADVTSGSLDLSFGRSAGTNFFNGFSTHVGGQQGTTTLDMGNLSIYVWGWAFTSIPDASIWMSISDGDSNYGVFNQSLMPMATSFTSTSRYGGAMVDAGAVWQAGSSTSSGFYAQIFYSYWWNATSNPATWTNSNATGTKYVNFFLEGDDGDIYGWVQLDWDVTDANDWSMTISNWAYSDDGPLAAGSTGAPAVPGLGGLTALAVGAAGVRGRRQRVAG